MNPVGPVGPIGRCGARPTEALVVAVAIGDEEAPAQSEADGEDVWSYAWGNGM